jgi:protein involved in polysaccharide export with SLBB domain
MTALPLAARLLSILIVLCTVATARAADSAPSPIAPHDLLHVSIADLTGPNVTTHFSVRVDGRGRISLPYVREVDLSGMTFPEAEVQIVAAYRDAHILESGQVAVQRTEKAANASLPAGPIVIGDTLVVRIWDLEGPGVETAQTWTVDPEGCIDLPRIGKLKLQDLTEFEAADFISRSYDDAKVIERAMVTVLRVAPGDGVPVALSCISPASPRAATAASPSPPPTPLSAIWRRVISRLDVAPSVFGALSAGLLLGVGLLYRGMHGRRTDDHPVCRRCSFDLFGLPPDHARCPECGGDLLLRPRKAIRLGHRERRPVSLTFGLLLLVPAALALAAVGWSAWQGADANQYKPAWWLALDLGSADGKVQKAAIGHLADRLQNGKLSRGDIDRVAARVLALQADLSRPWSSDFGDFVQDAQSNNQLGRERWKQYLRQAVPSKLEPPQRVRRGSIFPVKVHVGPARLGKSMGIGVEFYEPRIEVAGHAVDRGSMETLSPFVLNGPDTDAMTHNKLTVYEWGQLAHGVPDGPQPVRLSLDLRLRTATFDWKESPEAVRHVEWTGTIELLPAEATAVRDENTAN